MSAMQRVDSFGIVFPERWTAIPTEQREFDEFCVRAREKWRGAPDWDRAFERRADTLLARVRHELTKTGCVLASLYIDEVLDDSGSAPLADPEVVLIAACTLGVYTKEELRTKLSLSVPVLFGAFAKRRPGVEAGTRVGRVTNVVRPDVPELPAGRCVRLRRLYEPRKLGSSTERFFAESFIWPIGEDGESCCVLQFSTTNIEHSRQFSELFGAIANTFRMFEPDQPTSFD